MFKDIFELEDAKLKELDESKSEKEYAQIEAKYSKLLAKLEVELNEAVEKEVAAELQAIEDAFKKEQAVLQAEEDKSQKELEAQEEADTEAGKPVEAEESTIEEDYKNLSDDELKEKYTIADHKEFAETVGVEVKGGEKKIISTILNFLR